MSKRRPERDHTVKGAIIGVCGTLIAVVLAFLLNTLWSARQQTPDLRGSCVSEVSAQILENHITNLNFAQTKDDGIPEVLRSGARPALLCRVANVGSASAPRVIVTFKAEADGRPTITRSWDLGGISSHDSQDFTFIDAYSDADELLDLKAYVVTPLESPGANAISWHDAPYILKF